MLAGILVLFLVAACAQGSVVCPDGTVVATQADCPAPQAQQQAPPAAPSQAEAPAAPAETPPAAPQMDPALRALLDKASGVTSMTFVYAPIEMGPTSAIVNPGDTYLVRGDKARVDVVLPHSYDASTAVNTVYLDLAQKTAIGFCDDSITGCPREGEQRPAAYGDYAITLPTDWQVPASARIIGSRQFGSREVQIVRYQAGGKRYETYIDQFFGVPLRIGIYADSDYSQLVGGVEYQDAGFNNVKTSDVTPPQ